MDLTALQAQLRQFADERGWHPFHTPKNLSTALVVEAGELAEIFQWMTPEQSDAASADPATREHIGEEMADVLLYLVQMGMRTGIDLEAAVQDKLVKNAAKYPGL
jgi:NTP pyrophosphatase (non-canonical NTP hydrolase)